MAIFNCAKVGENASMFPGFKLDNNDDDDDDNNNNNNNNNSVDKISCT
jgi:hypothetical protein